MRMAFKTILATGFLLGAVPASAISLETTQAKPDARDPDEKVCEDITIVGSRLAVKRVCATRAQWAEKRRRDRDLVDQAQKSPCVVGRVSGGSAVCGN